MDARGPERAPQAWDPRREARQALTRVPLPDDVDPRELDVDVRAELRSLSKDTAERVAKHLVMTGRLLDDAPEQALTHARAAAALAGRVGSVREALGLAAYTAGEWAQALSELRAARRITGRADHLAEMADSERGLGRPERALALLDDPDVARLGPAEQVELAVVGSGARRDLGQPGAAVVLLQPLVRATKPRHPWAARLWYAYADALLAADRVDEAREWFRRVAEHDDGGTDADERLLEVDGVLLLDTQDADDEPAEVEPGGEQEDAESLAELARDVLDRARRAPSPPVPSAAPAHRGQATPGSCAAVPEVLFAAPPEADGDDGSTPSGEQH